MLQNSRSNMCPSCLSHLEFLRNKIQKVNSKCLPKVTSLSSLVLLQCNGNEIHSNVEISIRNGEILRKMKQGLLLLRKSLLEWKRMEEKKGFSARQPICGLGLYFQYIGETWRSTAPLGQHCLATYSFEAMHPCTSK